jgi:hypothetical protein
VACAVADDREARAAFLALRLPRRDHAGTGLKPEQFRPALGPAGLSATVQRAGSGRIEANSSTARPRLSLNPALVRCTTHGKFISGDTEFTLKRLENLFLLMLATERATLACPKEAI